MKTWRVCWNRRNYCWCKTNGILSIQESDCVLQLKWVVRMLVTSKAALVSWWKHWVGYQYISYPCIVRGIYWQPYVVVAHWYHSACRTMTRIVCHVCWSMIKKTNFMMLQVIFVIWLWSYIWNYRHIFSFLHLNALEENLHFLVGEILSVYFILQRLLWHRMLELLVMWWRAWNVHCTAACCIT